MMAGAKSDYGWIIFYRFFKKVCGKTQAEWDAAPQDDVIGITELKDGKPVINIGGEDWYCRGEKDGHIIYPRDKPQINKSLAYLFPAIKNGGHASTEEMAWLSEQRDLLIVRGDCGCG